MPGFKQRVGEIKKKKDVEHRLDLHVTTALMRLMCH